MGMRRTKQQPPVFPPEKAKDGGFGIEQYEGDNEYVKGLWPGSKILATEHVHIAPCGGYFNHKHDRGAEPHTHTHDECEWCERNRA